MPTSLFCREFFIRCISCMQNGDILDHIATIVYVEDHPIRVIPLA